MPKTNKLDKEPENLHYWIVVVTMILIALVLVIFSSIVADPIQPASPLALTATAEAADKSASSDRSPSIIIPGPPLRSSLRTREGETEATATSIPERLAYLDPEYFENSTETNGIIIGGTVIALIILISVLILLILERIRDNQSHAK